MANDPGAAPYGNFINYYSFNSAEDRISLLPDHIWLNSTKIANCTVDDSDLFLVLDLGCNAGNFTQLLYTYLVKHTKKTVQILGIDLDQGLIDRCNEHNEFPNQVEYVCLDIMEASPDVFRGHLLTYGKQKFDAVFCLSLTMWIHLNHGDQGLKDFLFKIAQKSNLLVIEPQSWKCYQTAVKRMKKSNKIFENFEKLTMRKSVENDIHQLLQTVCGLVKVFETIPTKWNRTLVFYRQKPKGVQ